jgi:NAD(P)-dependent dehydrogenase (short-subunit alcohol dehydrogenase family)
VTAPFRYDGRVALVTGAGGGLGRTHALLLAARGAKVVVNDLGSGPAGGGVDIGPAQKVVNEITAAGGEAAANTDSVTEGHRLVEATLDRFGRIDILINNAGFLRDVAFHNMKESDWNDIYQVHLYGAFRVAHAAWPHLRKQAFGRVINTSSAAGIYGNFGQTNYSSMKLAVHGFTQALAVEGRSKNILVNTIAPAADSRLTRTVMSEEQLKPMQPDYVSPLAAYLCHEKCQETGGLFEVGGGWVGKLRWERTLGAYLPTQNGISIEDIDAAWTKISDFSGAEHPGSMAEGGKPFAKIMGPG